MTTADINKNLWWQDVAKTRGFDSIETLDAKIVELGKKAYRTDSEEALLLDLEEIRDHL